MGISARSPAVRAIWNGNQLCSAPDVKLELLIIQASAQTALLGAFLAALPITLEHMCLIGVIQPGLTEGYHCGSLKPDRAGVDAGQLGLWQQDQEVAELAIGDEAILLCSQGPASYAPSDSTKASCTMLLNVADKRQCS